MTERDRDHLWKPRHWERPWVRSVPVKSMFRPAEHADIEAIAKGWGVPVATAVWAIVADQLARWRRRAPELGKHGLAIAAATTVLREKAKRDRNGTATAESIEGG